jgi:hypothetical protein
METLVLAFIGMTSAFLAELSGLTKTQGQQPVLATVKSTDEVNFMWHKIHVAAVTGQQMLAFVHYTVHV